MKKSTISNAAIKRIVTAQRAQGFGKWKLNFSKAQAKAEGLTDKQIEAGHEAFCLSHGVTDKKGMVEIIYATICE